MAILKRPMFRKGGSTNEGIMHGLERRGYADSNWKDIAAAYGHGKGTSTDVRNPLNYLDPDYREQMIESHTPTKIDWSWLKPRIRKHTLPSGDEIMLRGGIPIKQQETVPPEAIRGYDIPIPEGMPKEKIITDGTTDGTTGGAEGYPEGSFEARKHRLSERAKEYANLMHPMAKERLIAGSLAAASESFEKSTGNTKQDIARAISAAAKASDPTEMYSLGARLALQEDIELRGIKEAAKAKALYQNYAPSEKIKSFNELKKHMSEPEAIDRVFGSNNIYANVAEASSKEVGVPESSINIAAGQTYKEDYKGQVDPGDWEEFKDTAEDGFYKVGKKIYKVQTVEGKKKITVLADFASTKI